MHATLQQTVRYNHYSVARTGYSLDVYEEEGYGSRQQYDTLETETFYRGYVYRCTDDTRMLTTGRKVTETEAIDACIAWIETEGSK